MIRSVPNSCTSPTSVLNGCPASATSSPMRNTRGSRRISSAIASFTASPYVSSRTAVSTVAIVIYLAGLGRASGFERHVLVGGERAHPHVGDRVLGHAGTDPHERAQVHDRGVHHPVDGELLDLQEDGLALLGVALASLLQEHVVDVGIAAVGEASLGLDERLHAAGRVP